MKAAVIAFSERGELLAKRIADTLKSSGWEAESRRCPPGGLSGWVRDSFGSCGALIFVSSAGIAIRAVAPYIQSKLSDPAVLAADERANWVIPLLSGHIGGANELASVLAAGIGAQAVITTATDINGLFAVDVWAEKNGFVISNPGKIKDVSAKLLRGEVIRVKSELPVEISPYLSSQVTATDGDDCDVVVSVYQQWSGALWLIPKRLILGIGCRRGASKERIESVFAMLCRNHGIDPRALGTVVSIDVKSQEAGLLSFCQERGASLRFFTAEQLASVAGEFSRSGFVMQTVGVDNVCERAAVAAGGERIIAPKTASGGVTAAAAVSNETIHITQEHTK